MSNDVYTVVRDYYRAINWPRLGLPVIFRDMYIPNVHCNSADEIIARRKVSLIA